MLPSKTELQLAHKCHFDLYTITNMSVIDIAEYLTMRPKLIAITKHNLGNQDEPLPNFFDSQWLSNNT